MLHQACVSMRKHHRFRGLHGKVGALVGFGDSAFRNISWVSLFWDGNLPAGVAQSGALGNGAWKGWKSKIIPGKCRAEVQHSQMPQLVLGELGLKYFQSVSPPHQRVPSNMDCSSWERRCCNAKGRRGRNPGSSSSSLNVQELPGCVWLCAFSRLVSLFTLLLSRLRLTSCFRKTNIP